MNFTYKNHLKYYIGENIYGFRKTNFEKYQVKIGSVDMDHFYKSSFHDELRRTADYVYNDFGKDFVLFLSGGTDSEIVARNFLSIGIKPICYVVRLKDGYNSFDVANALELGRVLDLKINILEFDVLDYFYSGAAIDFAKKIQCTQITYLMVYQNILKLGLPAVMGGELLLRRNIVSTPSNWHYVFRENEDGSAIRFSLQYNIPLVNEWFSYTPELMLYYLQTPDIIKLVKEKYNYKLSSFSVKNEILHKLLPKLGLGNIRRKTHGFEELLSFNFEASRCLSNQQTIRLTDCLDGIEYEKTKKILLGQI